MPYFCLASNLSLCPIESDQWSLFALVKTKRKTTLGQTIRAILKCSNITTKIRGSLWLALANSQKKMSSKIMFGMVSSDNRTPRNNTNIYWKWFSVSCSGKRNDEAVILKCISCHITWNDGWSYAKWVSVIIDILLLKPVNVKLEVQISLHFLFLFVVS